MGIEAAHIKLEGSNSGTENITDIQNYLDSFNKEIEGNDITQVTTGTYYFCWLIFFKNAVSYILTFKLLYEDGNPVEHAYFIDQNVQYYYQTTTGDGQMVMVGGKLMLYVTTNYLLILKMYWIFY